MHPETAILLAQRHANDLRTVRRTSGGRREHTQNHSVRQRAGWTLVQIGLRLATGPGSTAS
jgi:hypothetical protein